MIKKVTSFFKERGLLKNVAVLTGGTLVAQLLNFLASPVLSRLYSKEDYGSFGLFMAAVSYTTVLACLRLEQAIVLPKNEEEAKSITWWCMRLNLVVSFVGLLVSLIVVFGFGLSAFYILVGPTVFFTTFVAIYSYYCSRNKEYKRISGTRITISVSITVLSIALGFISLGTYGLIGGMFLGQLFGSIYLYFHLQKAIHDLKNNLSWKSIRKKYSDFIFINTPHALLDLTEVYGVVLIMGFFFDKAYIGAYFFAFKLLKAPLKIIGSSIYQVLYREFSEKVVHNHSFLALFKKTIKQVALFSFPAFLILGIFGEELFDFVFGSEWAIAGVYASFFSLWFWLNFIANPVSCIPLVLNKQGISFSIAASNTVLRLVILFIAAYFKNFNLLIYLFAISQSIVMIVNISWYYFLVNKHHKQTLYDEA